MRELPFTVACGFAILCLLLPAAWHIRSRNSGTLLYLAWSLTGNIIYFVNSIVWAENIRNPAPIWCDISSKLIVGLGVGLPCASLCIQRRLYTVSRVRSVSENPATRRRALIIDLLIGLGIPILVMVLHYIVQGHRYDILEDVGCWPTVYSSVVAVPLVYMWPLIVSLISIPFCVLSYISFYRRRADFQRYLATNETGLNVDRYLRLMALASVELVVVLPLNIFSLVSNMTNGTLYPYTSWDDVHYNFGRVVYMTNFALTSNRKFYTEFTVARWVIPLSGFLFFLFFGLSIEARKDYNRAANLFLGRLGLSLPPPRQSSSARSVFDRILHRKSASSAKDPFANDNTLTDLPKYTPRGRRDTLASLDTKDDTMSTHTAIGRLPPIRIPDAVYSPIYRTSHATRPSLSHSETSDSDAFCHTGTSSTAFLLHGSPTTPTLSPWEAKPLPPIPGSRPTSVATTMQPGQAEVVRDESHEVLDPSAETSDLEGGLHPTDGGESIYYTPAGQRLSLMSTEYQPSIPDIPGAWYTNAKKKGTRNRPNPFF
ncbi:hypothetical protein M408DRAFT_330503 [Serendipita vermifera MAFF 305830]|uniref:Uncharacterized protein n=1 Tax=Serendipita vermifera MAFF 305830 TaxID=933852 RepID=A0A0C2XBK8_SERVB|nr:hypothetical protein M408DRAFT_330503 [Serendipita vermifera MAFF 305830]